MFGLSASIETSERYSICVAPQMAQECALIKKGAQPANAIIKARNVGRTHTKRYGALLRVNVNFG